MNTFGALFIILVLEILAIHQKFILGAIEGDRNSVQRRNCECCSVDVSTFPKRLKRAPSFGRIGIKLEQEMRVM